MKGWEIAIPSYNRPDRLQTATLALLKKQKIPKASITIFVANKEQESLYKKQVEPSLYGKIVVAKLGIVGVRNFIFRYYPLNAHVVCMDDDVEDILMLTKTNSLIPVKLLSKHIEEGFSLCEKYGYHLWGIYPIKNHFFMSEEPSTALRFIIGHMYGIINQKIGVKFPIKEDYHLTLQYAIQDGGVIRLNNLCAVTKMGAPGGIGSSVEERLEESKKIVTALEKLYPGLVRKNPKREGEILLSLKVPEGYPKKNIFYLK